MENKDVWKMPRGRRDLVTAVLACLALGIAIVLWYTVPGILRSLWG